MKKNKFELLIKIFSLFIFLPFGLTGQESKWYEFELENVKIDFPTEEVYQLDTIVKGIRLNQLYATIGNSTLILQKLPAVSSSKDMNLSSLPNNYESLLEYYNGVIDGVKQSAKAEKVKKEKINLGELIGYESVIYNNIEKPLIESRIFLAGNDLVMVSVHNPEIEINNTKNTFFNSLNLNNLDSLEQYSGKSKAYRLGYLFGNIFLYALLGVGIFFLIRTIRKKK